MKTTRKALLAQVGDFEIRLLRLFKTVVECGSFTAAEGRLGITRSAISLHMNDLEKRLGMRLCQRGRAGFSLTDEGHGHEQRLVHDRVSDEDVEAAECAQSCVS